MRRQVARPVPFGLGLILLAGTAAPSGAADRTDLNAWSRQPADAKGVQAAGGKATLTAETWSFLLGREDTADVAVAATLTILQPARRLDFFGESWSAWPDPAYGDGGYDAGLLLRAGEKHGYRVQLSHKYQDVALVKYPDGGYVRVAPFPVKQNQPHRLEASAHGTEVVVRVDGRELIR
jgi:hypothetical protein